MIVEWAHTNVLMRCLSPVVIADPFALSLSITAVSLSIVTALIKD